MSITTSTALAASVGRIAGLARPALRSQLASLPFLSNKLKGPFWPLAEPCITREETLLWQSRTPCIESSMIAKILMDGLDYSSASAKAKYYLVERLQEGGVLEQPACSQTTRPPITKLEVKGCWQKQQVDGAQKAAGCLPPSKPHQKPSKHDNCRWLLSQPKTLS